MWISIADYTRLLKADASQAATIEWLRVRVNQLEQERAELVAKVTGIQPVVPSIQKAPVLDPANPEAMFPTTICQGCYDAQRHHHNPPQAREHVRRLRPERVR